MDRLELGAYLIDFLATLAYVDGKNVNKTKCEVARILGTDMNLLHYYKVVYTQVRLGRIASFLYNKV